MQFMVYTSYLRYGLVGVPRILDFDDRASRHAGWSGVVCFNAKRASAVACERSARARLAAARPPSSSACVHKMWRVLA